MNNSQTKPYIGNHIVNILIGIAGLLVFIVGTLMPGSPIQKECFLIGGILLCFSSFLEKNAFFTVLEGIIVIDAVLTYFPLSNMVIAIVTAILVVVTIIVFAIKGSFNDKSLLVGTLGLIFLALGVGLLNPIYYTIGGLVIVIYSIFGILNGLQIAWLFLILNAIFTVTSAIGAYEWLTK
ncbi:MAG TPA: hypothetical protein DD381_08955 [Lentisphaeria bacterium]|nr:MAG: hypothetical protein A2X47_07905 [Lentisphaerae bacterium GWF2_38_69]HBM16450.1 hypothetical protein [Lentisphaeria bacterium]